MHLKRQYPEITSCIEVIFLLLTQKSLLQLVMGTNSLPDAINLALESHPRGLICTLYMQKTTPGDKDLWQKLIYDNKNSLLCLYSTRNKTIPDPDISFLEQCTINLIVGADYPYDFIDEGLYSTRSSYHSTFIIVSTDTTCRHFGISKRKSITFAIFNYFPYCKDVNNTIFPNAYIDYINSKATHANVTYLQDRQSFSVYLFEAKVKRSSNFRIFVYAPVWIYQIEKYCRNLVSAIDSEENINYCKRDQRFIYHFQIYFNLTVTNNIETRYMASGELMRLVLVPRQTKYTRSLFGTITEIYDDMSLRFMFCLQKPTSFLLSMEALVSPFDLFTWIGIGVTFSLLLFIRLTSKTDLGRIEKAVFNFKLMLDQSLPPLNSKGVLICLSFLVISAVYRMRVTSDLLVPQEVQPPKNISILVQKGYTMGYNYFLSYIFRQ